MTQYDQERPPVSAATAANSTSTKDSDSLERSLKSLSDRVQQQDLEIRELQKILRRLQNEIRTAVNAFNLNRNG